MHQAEQHGRKIDSGSGKLLCKKFTKQLQSHGCAQKKINAPADPPHETAVLFGIAEKKLQKLKRHMQYESALGIELGRGVGIRLPCQERGKAAGGIVKYRLIGMQKAVVHQAGEPGQENESKSGKNENAAFDGTVFLHGVPPFL